MSDMCTSCHAPTTTNNNNDNNNKGDLHSALTTISTMRLTKVTYKKIINQKGEHDTSDKIRNDYDNIQIHAFKQLSHYIVHT